MHVIAQGLITEDNPPHLIGGRERDSGRVVFPCPTGDRYDRVVLSRTGTLWSYTIQRYRPKSPPYKGPEAFRPWAVAYVELPGEVIVESRLTDIAFEDIRIGMPLELTMIPLDPDAADPVMIPAFRPAGDAA
ncbi:Zn-ribbon domain-containing OB-fold protein [Novosphingobium subterraneum]|uniref:Putative nucleic-acid-binding protein n=1 Tax=Novosphingobium subterraneum TaxID=48936 RepID=A0A0B9A366_9SPHN|nr:OB-fold domain-containing protein [Novosphingobium subterraneum]KHS45004.1 putative nucleic-acid-binding protein [Novosphingobium subterraneum]